jgi:phenylalanine-4-hydroxylase
MFTEFEISDVAPQGTKSHIHLTRPPGTAEDWTIPQHWERFTAEEHRVWDLLFARQKAQLAGRVVRAFEEGLDVLRLSRPGIPELSELNERLDARTGWSVVSVPGLVPDDIFFQHLASRRFPAGNFIRTAEQLDYLEEPDVFHDVFGHVPMLANPEVGDFMQALGEAGLAALTKGNVHRLSRLYWYAIEFGLAREDGALKIYGAGIASSFQESAYSLESAVPERLPFDLRRVLRTRYRSDALQRCYFVVDSFEDLLGQIASADLDRLYDEVAALDEFEPGAGALSLTAAGAGE